MATIKPQSPHDPAANARAMREALEAYDEDRVIDILLNICNDQRQQLALQYKSLFGANLHVDFKSYLSTVDIATTCSALTVASANYAARELQYYQNQSFIDECALIDILCARPKSEVLAINVAYDKVLGASLVDDLQRDNRLVFEGLLVSDALGQRQEGKDVDSEMARREAQLLYECGDGVWGGSQCEFMQILTIRSHQQLRRTFMDYESLAGCTIEESIGAKMDSALQRGCKEFVTFVKDSLMYYAMRIHGSLRGEVRDESTYRREIIYRSEIDMAYVRGMFEQFYQTNLRHFIEREAVADFKKILVLMIG